MEHQDAQLISGGLDNLKNIRPRQTKLNSIEPEGLMMLATGVTAGQMEFFGLDIIDVARWTIMTSLRWPSTKHITKGGWAPFANPTFLWVKLYAYACLRLAPPTTSTSRWANMRRYCCIRSSDVSECTCRSSLVSPRLNQAKPKGDGEHLDGCAKTRDQRLVTPKRCWSRKHGSHSVISSGASEAARTRDHVVA